VRVEGQLEPGLSRWLWLVKWLLLIPHLIVLLLLWIAFVIVSVAAFFAILITARYPRALFEFNVGVLRWTWRVGFYSYSALATDRYPPFTLAHVPEYPASLQIAYPERLSRGLVLVKWWLLAIPHYVVIGIFAGGWGPQGGANLIAVLAFFAGVSLLFRTAYPGGIFDFVMGLNRWTMRVAAYAALMRDEYPPFRLDLGPGEPELVPPSSAPPPPAAPPPTTEAPRPPAAPPQPAEPPPTTEAPRPPAAPPQPAEPPPPAASPRPAEPPPAAPPPPPGPPPESPTS
jgi:hypothetical protein